jgi:hypothetical protein
MSSPRFATMCVASSVPPSLGTLGLKDSADASRADPQILRNLIERGVPAKHRAIFGRVSSMKRLGKSV